MLVPEKDYKRFVEFFPILTADVAIKGKHGLLLVKRASPPCSGEWFFPGGRLFKYETFADCAKRKAKEEVGLDVRIGVILGWFGFRMDGRHSYGPVFIGTPEDGQEVVLDSGSTDYRWCRTFENSLDVSHETIHDFVGKVWRVEEYA